MKNTTIAVDVAKSIFEVAVSHRPGHVAERERLARDQILQFFANRPRATVLLEACGSAYHWARELQGLGHRVVLLPPHLVRRYVPANKTDRSDAKGLLEAFRNRDIHPVPIKSVAQQSLMALHRLRSTWLATRTARLNSIRGLLREFGLIIPVGAHHVLQRTSAYLEDADSAVPDALRPSLAELVQEVFQIEHRIRAIERQLQALASQTPVAERLLTIPGVGLLTATALVAYVGDIQRFPTARHFASYLGLTPRERSSGYIRRLGAISKRGDCYLRMLLIHGARAVLAGARPHRLDRLRAWALKLQTLRGHNKATVALANKLARIVWAVWKNNARFQIAPAA
jgi:transposase